MKKRTKKALLMCLIIISMLAMFGQSAFAITTMSQNLSQDLLKEIDKTNEYVFNLINKTKEKAEKEALKKNKSEEEFGEYLDHLLEKLVEKTENKADKLIEKAKAEGVLLEKTYIEVEICGKVVLVDPFYAH